MVVILYGTMDLAGGQSMIVEDGLVRWFYGGALWFHSVRMMN